MVKADDACNVSLHSVEVTSQVLYLYRAFEEFVLEFQKAFPSSAYTAFLPFFFPFIF